MELHDEAVPIGGIPSNDKGIRGAVVTDDSAQADDAESSLQGVTAVAVITFNYLMSSDAGTEPASANIVPQSIQDLQNNAINLICGSLS
ncbi:hypothetical protein PE067_13970 [Paracoccus sp. DMF-8]|uniref:hypothetical protein n=1 Tax=Paracoccus sp. DMF-8 TaxID=3019445 RepID=UPI0023E82A24|nr:hypothetical protein [Paracoccus sp. DMF-8]MDF3607144.1 hypothetical protein [Paracoccus sp. DMF-8]